MKNLLSRLKRKANEQESIELTESKPEIILLFDEKSKQIGESIRKYSQLIRWMEHNEDDIFEVAPDSALYAVGTWKKGKPEIHYFDVKYTKKGLFNTQLGAIDYLKELAEKGETNTCFIYKHQKDVYMMLACG